ncbi:Clavaminate synthase-like protein [Fistulina hepatica ATCC 64428]|uniref:Clavaminate synthase-like protein n=1 Tax=Fistulina hepatica ATCC 64428 TaxID=1128425 RepID=A0A0D6ZYM8_9AGAR|nr:Clavaminate synthase-like protein [Fistulina hepatica ATCC 64428]
MPTLALEAKPALVPYVEPQETSSPLDWAPLVTIDLSKFDEPGGKETLVAELKDAIRRWGFWVVVGTNIPQEDIDRQLSIANAFFNLPIEEKRKESTTSLLFVLGSYFGYREPKRFIGKSDVKENMEMVRIDCMVPRHDFIKIFEDEIAPFHRQVWYKVARKLYVLLALVLKLPEDYFVKLHDYEQPSEDHLRYMIYHPRSAEDDEKINGIWSLGHTDRLDFGSLTLLFAQQVAALQIRTPDEQWKWVKPVKGGITCNAADIMSFLTKVGYVKSTVHRVVRPPPDQANNERLGLFYFSRPGNDVLLRPAPSPVLRKLGLLTPADEDESGEDVKGIDYVRARVKNVHDRQYTRNGDVDVQSTFHVKHLKIQDYYL